MPITSLSLWSRGLLTSLVENQDASVCADHRISDKLQNVDVQGGLKSWQRQGIRVLHFSPQKVPFGAEYGIIVLESI